jgi:hypothetical protein
MEGEVKKSKAVRINVNIPFPKPMSYDRQLKYWALVKWFVSYLLLKNKKIPDWLYREYFKVQNLDFNSDCSYCSEYSGSSIPNFSSVDSNCGKCPLDKKENGEIYEFSFRSSISVGCFRKRSPYCKLERIRYPQLSKALIFPWNEKREKLYKKLELKYTKEMAWEIKNIKAEK